MVPIYRFMVTALYVFLLNQNKTEEKINRSHREFPEAQLVKNPPVNAGDAGDISSFPGSGRSPGEGNCYPLQYSCLENSMNREPGGLQSMRS